MRKDEMAESPNTHVDVLTELSKDDDWEVRLGVAENPNTPKDVLIELSKDDSREIRYIVALNPNTPKDVLIELSKDKDCNAICSVASKNLEDMENTMVDELKAKNADKRKTNNGSSTTEKQRP